MKQKEKERREKVQFVISLKVQLVIGFAVPIILMVVVGMVSYYSASSGMIENYENSAVNALDMTMECMERGFAPCVANALELANNTTVSSYVQGGFDVDSSRQSTARQSVTKDILVKQTTNDFIENIHIIPNGNIIAMTTANTSNANVQGFMQRLRESEDQGMMQETGLVWGSRHPFVDERCGLSEDGYILYCSYRVGTEEQGGLVIIDIRAQAVRSLMEQLDFGEGSYMAFITADGREIGWDESIRISELEFYTGEDATQYVTYNGVEYFYMARQSETTGGDFVVMVPKSSITGRADHIRRITLFMVALAGVAAALLGCVIIGGISSNIGASIHTLNEVAGGNLAVKTRENGKHEFGRLYAAIQNTVKKIRELIDMVKQVMRQVSDSGIQVSESSGGVNRMVHDMRMEIDEIGRNITQEDSEIDMCNAMMEALSARIKQVNADIQDMIAYINTTKQTVSTGMDMVRQMTQQSAETSSVTGAVKEQVCILGSKLGDIVQFVDVIELDKELEKRGLRFVRYADDCVIAVRSEASAKRVMYSVTDWIERKLGLKVNAEKTRITRPGRLKYLGFGFYKDSKAKEWKCRPHKDSVEKFKRTLKKLTNRSQSMPFAARIQKLNWVIRGWINYFALGSMKTAMNDIDAHLRTRLRVIIWKQWKVPKKRQWGLQKLGIGKDVARLTSYYGDHYQWIVTKTCVVRAISKEKLSRAGLISCYDYYMERHALKLC